MFSHLIVPIDIKPYLLVRLFRNLSWTNFAVTQCSRHWFNWADVLAEKNGLLSFSLESLEILLLFIRVQLSCGLSFLFSSLFRSIFDWFLWGLRIWNLIHLSCLSSGYYSKFKAARYTLVVAEYTSKTPHVAAWPQPNWAHFATVKQHYCTLPQAGHTFHSSCLIDRFHPYRCWREYCSGARRNDGIETRIAIITHGIYAPKPFRFIPLSRSSSKSSRLAINYHGFPARLSDFHLCSKSSYPPKYQIYPWEPSILPNYRLSGTVQPKSLFPLLFPHISHKRTDT